MKKTIVLIITVLLACTFFFTACNGYGYDIPNFDDFNLTGEDGNGVSGTPSLSFLPLTPNSDKPLSLEEIIYEVSNEDDVWNDEYYSTTLSLSQDEQGKMVKRRRTLTYVRPVTNDDAKPSNKNDFYYISNAMAKEIYEVDYLYNCKKVSVMPNANNDATPYYFVLTGGDWINHKLFDFMRYVYLQTGGKVNLEFSYDTSFNYQTDEFGGGIVIRAKITVTQCSLNDSVTLSELLNAQVGNDTLLNVFNSTGHRLGVKLISDTTLSNGASTWCDIQIGVPNLSPADNGLWAYMLYYYNQI